MEAKYGFLASNKHVFLVIITKYLGHLMSKNLTLPIFQFPTKTETNNFVAQLLLRENIDKELPFK